jgi:chemotaxis protein MotB
MSGGGEEARANELVIIRRHGGGEEGGHKGGVWKIAYADFMTAMMAFFLVMWLINATDKKTLTQVATYFNPLRLTDKMPSSRGLHQSETMHQSKEDEKQGQAEPGAAAKPARGEAKAAEEALFHDPYETLSRIAGQAALEQRQGETARPAAGEAGLTGGEAQRDPFDPAFRRQLELSAPQAAPAAGARPERGPEGVAAQQVRERELAETASLEAAIRQALEQSGPGTLPNIDVTITPEGVLISLTDGYDFGMFAIASAEPRPAMVVVMERLAGVLKERIEPLVVRGHTDGRPYKSGAYDNWRLSTARAHMAYYMLVRGGVGEQRFERIEGHADRDLRIPGDPEAAQNRRIEILLRRGKP